MSKTATTWIVLNIFILQLTIECAAQVSPVKIALSKASRNYVEWLKRSNPAVETIDLYPLQVSEALKELATCNALLLTGGEDVYPAWYGRETDTSRCTEMNRRRDTLDMALIHKALEMKMPVMAICRGHQILNVALGGSLIIDIPEDIGKDVIHQCEDYLKCFHPAVVSPGTMLSDIVGVSTAEVTTNHHQAIQRLSDKLSSNAFSAEGVIEGAEWKDPEGKSFLLGVQWHPERMPKDNPLSGNIADQFIREAMKFSPNNIQQARQ